MLLEKIIEALPDFTTPDQVLVCEADFVGLRGAVMQKSGDVLNVSHEVYSEELDLNGAVKELVQQARKKGWKGKQAILLSPAVTLTSIEMSIPHQHKLNPKQMTEAVNWELEPVVMQQQHLRIGQILIANGYLNAEQVDTILVEQETANRSKERDALYKRLGEFAKDFGYITQNQLEQCLARQVWFKPVGDTIHSHWLPQTQGEQANADAGLFPWLVVGMSKGLLRQWQAAFSQEQVKLVQCYPLTGSALAILSGLYKAKTSKADMPEKHLLLEWHEGQLTAINIQQQRASQVLTLPAHRHDALNQLSEAYHALAIETPDVFSFIDSASQSEQEAKQLSDDLKQVTQQSIQNYPKPSGNYSLGMRGAAAHFLFKKIRKQLVAVTAADPRPALIQRFEVRSMLAAALVVSFILLSEIGMLGWGLWMDAQSDALAPDLEKVNAEISLIQAQVDEVKTYKKEVKDKKNEVKTKQAALTLLSTDLPKRNETIYQFLQALEQTITEDVVIDTMTEDTVLGFNINGWSISEQAAQGFVRRFQIAIHALGYQLKDISVNQQTGRLGLVGYAITFNATTLDEEDWAAAKLNPYGHKVGKKKGLK